MAQKNMMYVLSADLRDIIYSDDQIPEEFRFSDEIERKHNVIMLYINLQNALTSLQDVEYYFRRYPFHDLPVSHNDHITRVCEMYFGHFYEFSERMKKYLNALNEIRPVSQ